MPSSAVALSTLPKVSAALLVDTCLAFGGCPCACSCQPVLLCWRLTKVLIPFLFVVCAVQHEAIPRALMRQDILCQAKSGMGKTAVFVISILQNLEPKKGVVQALVLCHTRELSFQVRPCCRSALYCC